MMWMFKLLVAIQLFNAAMATLVAIGPYRHSLISTHNHYRRKMDGTGMREMVWDTGLATAAETWSFPCKFGTFDEALGQNMYYLTGKEPDKEMIKRSVKNWNDAANDNLNPKGKCKGDCDKAQMLWDNSTSLGCALRQCPSLDLGSGKVVNHAIFLVCLYWPKIPETTKMIFTHGKPCSDCPKDTECTKDLCTSKANVTIAYHEELAKKMRAPPYFHQRFLRTMISDGTKRSRRQLANGGSLSNTEEYYVLTAHNTLRRRTNKQELLWNSYLSRWANYVIRCNIEYPGPRTAYTNFGKLQTAGERHAQAVYTVVFKWGNEGYQTDRELRAGCRTPMDEAQCNHNTNLMVDEVRGVGCAAMDCQDFKQLTCIYK